MNDETHPMESPAEPPPHFHPWQALWRRKWLVALGALAGLALGTLYCVVTGPQYESTATVLVIKKRVDNAPIAGAGGGDAAHEDYLSTHQSIIGSLRVVEEAVRQGKLDTLPSFQDTADVAAAIGNSLTVARGSKKVGGTSNNVLNLSFRGKSPGDSTAVLNAIIVSYRHFLAESYRKVNAESRKLIAGAKEVLKEEIDAKEEEWREFRRRSPLPLRGREGTTVQQERLSRIDAERSTLQLRQAQMRATLTAIKEAQRSGRSRAEILAILPGPPSNLDLPGPTATPRRDPAGTGRGGRGTPEEELLSLQLREAELLADVGPRHPDVEAVRRRIETLRGLLTPSAARGDDSPQRRGREEDMIQTKIQLLQREYEENRRTEAGLAALFQHHQEEAKAALVYQSKDESYRQSIELSKQLYHSLVKRLEEIDAIRGYGGFDTDILEEPQPGKLVIKNILLVTTLGLFCGLLGGLGWAVKSDIADKSFRTPEEVWQRLQLPVVGSIPVLKAGAEALKQAQGSATAPEPLLCTYYQSESAAAEAYRRVRTAVYFSTREKCQVIQITSPERGDGKTTLAANLAASIALSGRRVLLIDADLRAPRLHEVYRVRNEVGLSSVLRVAADLGESIQPTAIPGLWVLPSGPLPPNPSELLVSPRLKGVLDSLRGEYDFILVDTPPLLNVTDSSVVAHRVDAVLLSLQNSKRCRPSAERALEVLDGLGAAVLGVVVNRVKGRPGSYAFAAEAYDAAVGYPSGQRTGGPCQRDADVLPARTTRVPASPDPLAAWAEQPWHCQKITWIF